MSETRAPRGLGDAGKRLWRSVTGDFDLAEHELAQLEQACRVRDRIGDLDAVVETDGLMIDSSQGARLHPGVAEARQQRLALARLLVSLGVPGMDEDDLPAAGRVRGVYSGRRSR